MLTRSVTSTLRPPPHRDYLHGYPGIPAFDTSDVPVNDMSRADPLFPSLVVQSRSQACLSGTVEVRAAGTTNPRGKSKKKQGNKDQKSTIRARWLRIELEKIETLPPPGPSAPTRPMSTSGSKKNGTTVNGKDETKFVELIGVGPGTLWSAEEQPNATEDDSDDTDDGTAVRWGSIEEVTLHCMPGHRKQD